MKYLVILGDGMADEPLEELNGLTPLTVAKTPEMDRLARHSEIGLVKTIPDGMSPGSDTANLAVLGYDPKKYYTGRSPLEALSIGVPMRDTDIALRCNLVTLSDDDVPYEEKTMIDHSSGELTTQEAAELIETVKEAFDNEVFQFYLGTSYRHLTIWDKGLMAKCTPPHDILGRKITTFLPEDEVLRDMMVRSYDLLKDHPVNLARGKAGRNKANSIWFWGAGTKPSLDSFTGRTGLRGVMISAVDLLKGIAVGAGMTNINVEGATGTLETNYEGKAQAAVDALLKDGYDFAYLHLEAPDEMGHQGSIPRKIQAIEALDQRIIRNITAQMDASGEPYRMLIMPDHRTPIWCRTHTSDPIPYMIFDSRNEETRDIVYNEFTGKESGIYLPEGYRLIDKLLEK